MIKIMTLIIQLWPVWLLIILRITYRKLKPAINGFIGEQKIHLILQTLPNDKYTVLNNVMLNSERGTTQIDHIIVSSYGIFVIETKNFKGWIYGNDNSDKWTQVLYKRKYQFPNPLHQNYKHCVALKTLIGNDKIKIISIVAFSSKAKLKIKTFNNVIYYKHLYRLISRYDDENISTFDCDKIVNAIQQHNITDKTLRKKHIVYIEERVENEREKVKNNICPKCGEQLVLRFSRYGRFIGCSNFPKCKYKTK